MELEVVNNEVLFNVVKDHDSVPIGAKNLVVISYTTDKDKLVVSYREDKYRQSVPIEYSSMTIQDFYDLLSLGVIEPYDESEVFSFLL